MNLHRTLTLLLSLIAACTAARADAVDDYMRATLARTQIPGASVLIVRGGQVQKAQGYGFANVELQVPAGAATIYQSGSTGKQFTAAGILLLAEAGKLSLDDHPARFFDGAPPSWQRITVRQLLTHTSGLRDYENTPAINLRKDYDEAALLEVLKQMPLDFEPGTQWSYSNSGYMLLGLITSKVAGEHWSDYQARMLFKPLGMKTTRVISESDIIMNRAAGYELDAAGHLKNQDWVAPSLNRSADGALYYSILDLAAWDAALRAGHFLTPASQKAWMTPVTLSDGSNYQYGFGWDIGEQRGHRLIEHGGSWQGFRTQISRYVDDDLSVMVLTNLASAEPGHMAHDIAGLLEPQLRLPDPGAVLRDPDARRAATLQAVLRAWAEGRVNPAMARGLAHTATHTEGEALWRRKTGEALASMKAFHFLGEDVIKPSPLAWRNEPVTRIAHYALISDTGRHVYRFYLTAKGQVADFNDETR
jgi:CubicO group peptidase (beta-lactamase class C family)